MVKTEGKQNHVDCGKARKLNENMGKCIEIRGNKNVEIGVRGMYNFCENGGKLAIFSKWLRKSSEILVDEHRIFVKKGNWEIFP